MECFLREKASQLCAIADIKTQQAQHNDLIGLFYLLWFQSLTKYFDAAGTKTNHAFDFKNIKLSFHECKHKDKEYKYSKINF